MKALCGRFEEARQLCLQVGGTYHELGMQMSEAQNRADAARIEMLSGDISAAERQLRASLGGLTALGEKPICPREPLSWQRFYTFKGATARLRTSPESARRWGRETM